MQLQRAQNRAMEQSKTGLLKPPKPPKIRREQSAHRSKKLNEWNPKDMEDVDNMYRNSRALGYKGKPVSDSVDHCTIDLFLYCSYQ